jgi:hypothetical protein
MRLGGLIGSSFGCVSGMVNNGLSSRFVLHFD